MPWHVGRGRNRITGGGAGGTPASSFNGVWCFDHFQPGENDSLMGWWPVAIPYASTGGAAVGELGRPFMGLDYGNQGNYRPIGSLLRTFGVVGIWHRDGGNSQPPVAVPTTNPAPLTWLPLAGVASAWCGLRAHGDLAILDPITHNAFNQSILDFNRPNRGLDGGTGTAAVAENFPGYGSQWDQMLYRDVTIANNGVSLNVIFQYRTSLSTGGSLDPNTRVGWFDKDPLLTPSAQDGNFISATAAGNRAPVDSFMVYIGVPVDTTAGNVAQYFGSDALPHALYDRQRRWFSEVIRINKPYAELLSKSGVNAAQTFSVTVPNATIQPILDVLPGLGGTIRIVFRVKTNRGWDDEDGGVSGFSSGTAGAAIVDEVNVNTGGANLITNGNFEAASSIDNNLAVAATTSWKTTGKPPGVFFHVHNLGSLIYDDPAGPPGSSSRNCNMFGNVVTPGDHDMSEKPGGVFGTTFQDRQDALVSPTINLRSTGPGDFNGMGIDADAASASSGYALWFDIYSGFYRPPSTGNGYRIGWQCYPATQPNGVKCWGEVQKSTILSAGDIGCFSGFRGSSPGAFANGLIVTSNPNGVPDSLRVLIEHVARCYTFGLSAVDCSPDSGGYFDNISLAFIDACGTRPADYVATHVSADGLVDPIDPHPGLLTTQSGILVSAWARKDGRVSYARSGDKGFMFSRVRHIARPAGRPALARTALGSNRGTVLIATSALDGVSVSRSWDEGISFLPPVPIPGSAGGAHAGIGVDTPGNSHVVWDNGVNVYYSKSLGSLLNTFASATQLMPDEGGTRPHRFPDVAAASGSVHVVWAHTHTTGSAENWIQQAVSINGGGNFGSAVSVSDQLRSAREPRLLALSSTVYALWIYDGTPDVVHLSSAPAGSASFQDLTEVQMMGTDPGTTHALSAAIGGDGTIFVVVQANVGGVPQCFYLRRPAAGGSFTSPLAIAGNPSGSIAPAISLDGSGKPVIVWAEDFGGAPDVFFRQAP